MATSAAPSTRQGAEELLDALLAQPGIRGAMLLSRDGFPVLARSTQITAPDTFAAMQAASLGAAELAYEGVGGATHLTLMVDLGPWRFLTRGAGDSYILVAQMDAQADLNLATEGLAAACGRLAKLK